MRRNKGIFLALAGAAALCAACASVKVKHKLAENKGGKELKAADIQKLTMAAEAVFQAQGYTVQTAAFPQGPGKDGFVVQGSKTKDKDVDANAPAKGEDKGKVVKQHVDNVYAYFWHEWNAQATDAVPGVVLYFIDGEAYDLTLNDKKLNEQTLTLTQSVNYRDQIVAKSR